MLPAGGISCGGRPGEAVIEGYGGRSHFVESGPSNRNRVAGHRRETRRSCRAHDETDLLNTQLPNNLHLWERDQRHYRNFLHQWTVCSTTVNWALSKTWCTIIITMYQEAEHATKALLANRAALTQNMNIMYLKTKVSGSAHGTQWNKLKKSLPKLTVQN